ncbi:MAG: FecR domain-containing protein [Niastella sp.]|nr:FecR domain-containing protein [Niastella sp.]
MNTANQPDMTELIGKYLAGEANPTEAMQLDDWLADAGNAAEFQRMAALWHQLPGETSPQPPASSLAWTELEPLLHSKPQRGIVRFVFNRYVAAAVAGMLIILSVVWFNRRGKESQADDPSAYVMQTATQEIKSTTLPDSTFITVNQHSEVAYAADFGKPDRQLSLQGECYFDVTPDKQHPFIIQVADLTIKVVGTSFNVQEITPSGHVTVQVQSGVVQLYALGKMVTVQKGQSGFYHKQLQQLYVANSIDINSFGYATRSFSFNDIAFADACRYLEQAFHVSFMMDKQVFAGCRLTAHFDNKPLSYILDVINATLNISSRQEGDSVFITGNGCH